MSYIELKTDFEIILEGVDLETRMKGFDINYNGLCEFNGGSLIWKKDYIKAMDAKNEVILIQTKRIHKYLDELEEYDETIEAQAKEIERINTAFKRKIQNLETRYNAMIHRRDRKIDKLQEKAK